MADLSVTSSGDAPDLAATAIQHWWRGCAMRTVARRHIEERREEWERARADDAARAIQRLRRCRSAGRRRQAALLVRDAVEEGLVQERDFAARVLQRGLCVATGRLQRQRHGLERDASTCAQAVQQERTHAAEMLQRWAPSVVRQMRPTLSTTRRTATRQADRFASEQERLWASRVIGRASLRFLGRASVQRAVAARAIVDVDAAVAQELDYQEYAAVAIQCAARKRVARLHTNTRRQVVHEAQLALRRDEASAVLVRSFRRVAAERRVQERRSSRAAQLEARWVNDAATLVQTLFRGMSQRRAGQQFMHEERLRRRNRAALRVQCGWRQFMARAVYRQRYFVVTVRATRERMHRAATSIQAVARGRAARRMHAASIKLCSVGPCMAQRVAPVARAFQCRRALRRLQVQTAAALKIQRAVRNHNGKRSVNDRRRIRSAERSAALRHYSATVIQALVRGRIGRRVASALRPPSGADVATCKIQRSYRRHLAAMELHALRIERQAALASVDMHQAVVLCQARARGFIARCLRAHLQDERDTAMQLIAASTLGFATRLNVARKCGAARVNGSAEVIQKAWKCHVATKEAAAAEQRRLVHVAQFQERTLAASRLAAWWRGVKPRRDFQERAAARTESATAVQCMLRSLASQVRCSAMALHARDSLAAAKLQRAWGAKKKTVRERREARGLELRLVAIDLQALQRREALDRHYLGTAQADAIRQLLAAERNDGASIEDRLRQREQRWLARHTPGERHEASKRMQASVRSFATRRRQLLSGASEAPSAGGQESSPAASSWFDWLQAHRDTFGPRAARDVERLVRSECGRRDQLGFEQRTMWGALVAQAERGTPTSAAPPETGGPSATVKRSTIDLSNRPELASQDALRAALHPHFHRLDARRLVLENSCLTDACCAAIAAFVDACPSVLHVSLRFNRITDIGATQLIKCSRRGVNAPTIDLSSNFAAAHFVEALRRPSAPPAQPKPSGVVGRTRMRVAAASLPVRKVAAPVPASAIPLVADMDDSS